MAQDRYAAKTEISNYCRNNLYRHLTSHFGIGTAPILLLVFLGDETRNKIAKTVVEEINTMTSIDPVMADIYYSKEDAGKFTFRDRVHAIVRDFAEKGKLIEGYGIDINLSFVSLMHDPFFDEIDINTVIGEFKEAIASMGEIGIKFREVSFYGMFNANMRKVNAFSSGYAGNQHDYSKAFAFINSGRTLANNIWDNIYHLEACRIRESYDMKCRTVAIQILHDALEPLPMAPAIDFDAENYKWKAIGFYELKIPEKMLCRMLIDGYKRQIIDGQYSKKEIDAFTISLQDKMKERFYNEIELFSHPEVTRYMPQIPEEEYTPEKRKGFFGSLFHKKEEEYIPAERTVDEDDIRILLEAAMEGKKDKITDIILHSIRAAFGTMDTIESDKMQLANKLIDLCSKVRLRETEQIPAGNTFEEERENAFIRWAERICCEQINSQLERLTTDKGYTEKFKEKVNLILAEIYKDIDQSITVLDELRVNQYGAAIYEERGITPDTFTLKLGTRLEKACEELPQEKLLMDIAEEGNAENNILYFIDNASKKAENLKSMGKIKGKYHADPVAKTLLTRDKVNSFTGRQIVNEVLLPNTIQVLAYCTWNSQVCLTHYYNDGDVDNED